MFFSYNWAFHDEKFAMQSVSSKQKENALVASFVHSPVGEHVDWRLSATISPCHVTVIPYSCSLLLDCLMASFICVINNPCMFMAPGCVFLILP